MEKQTARAAWETGGTRSHFWKGSSAEVSLEHDGDLSPGGSADLLAVTLFVYFIITERECFDIALGL